MTRWTMLKRGGLATAVALLVASSVGCNNTDKETIAALTADRDSLAKKVTELQAMNTATSDKNSQLQNDLNSKNQEIARLQQTRTGGTTIVDRGTTDNNSGKAEAGGEWTSNRFGDKLSIGSDVLFSSGKADLTAAGKERLDKAVADMKKHYSGRTVLVYGYTDTDPIKKTKNLWTDNLDLSANRAMAVTRYLISKGLKSEQIETVAMGDTHSVAGNKAKSRRVELVVVKPGASAAEKTAAAN